MTGRRYLAWIMLISGGLAALLSGGCVLFDNPGSFSFVLIFAGPPFALGILAVIGGRQILRDAKLIERLTGEEKGKDDDGP